MKVKRNKDNPESYLIFDEYSDFGNGSAHWIQDGRVSNPLSQCLIDVAREALQPGQEGTILFTLSVVRSRGV